MRPGNKRALCARKRSQQKEPRNFHLYHQVERRTAQVLAAANARAEERIRLSDASERRKQSGRKQKPRQTADGIWTNWRSAEKRLGIRLQRTSRNGSRTNTTRRSACWSTCVIRQPARNMSQYSSRHWRNSAKPTPPRRVFCVGSRRRSCRRRARRNGIRSRCKRLWVCRVL